MNEVENRKKKDEKKRNGGRGEIRAGKKEREIQRRSILPMCLTSLTGFNES